MSCKPTPYKKIASPYADTQPYRKISAVYSEVSKKYLPFVFPYDPICFGDDVVEKLFENLDIFLFQNGSQYIFNLKNDTM